jgi:hypothetical protein
MPDLDRSNGNVRALVWSSEDEMSDELFQQITHATGLPIDLISKELNRLILAAGANPNTLTMDQLRLILADYVQDVLVNVQSIPVDPNNSKVNSFHKKK